MYNYRSSNSSSGAGVIRIVVGALLVWLGILLSGQTLSEVNHLYFYGVLLGGVLIYMLDVGAAGHGATHMSLVVALLVFILGVIPLAQIYGFDFLSNWIENGTLVWVYIGGGALLILGGFMTKS